MVTRDALRRRARMVRRGLRMVPAQARPRRSRRTPYSERTPVSTTWHSGPSTSYRASGDPQYLTDALDWIHGHEFTGPITWDSTSGPSRPRSSAAPGGAGAHPDAAALGCPFSSRARPARQPSVRSGMRSARRETSRSAPRPEHGGAGAVLALAGVAGFASGRRSRPTRATGSSDGTPWGRSFSGGAGSGVSAYRHHWASRAERPPSPVPSSAAPPPARSPARAAPRFKKGPFDGPAGFYQDRATNYVTSEVALDYASSTILMLAAVAARARDEEAR